ncbi:hypothetical protein E2320_009712, partial [Naja naja]
GSNENCFAPQSSLLTVERHWEPTLKKRNPAPEATFTPTAIAQRIAAGLQQGHRTASVAFDTSPHVGQHLAPQVQRGLAFQGPRSPSSSIQSREWLSGDEDQKELILSEDEGLAPDSPGLHRALSPALFKSLLYKAKTIAHMGAEPRLPDPNELLFSETTTESEEIPSPKLFLDVI